MFSALKLQFLTPSIRRKNNFIFAGNLTLSSSPATILRLQPRRFSILSAQSSENAPSSEPSVSSQFTSSVGSPPLHLSHLRLSQRHITVLNVLACAVAISATWLFCSAIPALLDMELLSEEQHLAKHRHSPVAFKRAAESLEKLLDVTREELPDTMAAVRLSGMEISDLTMELSDLGQEITQGVRKSTRAVHVAEEKLRHFANMTSAAPMQERVSSKITTTVEPALAITARGFRQGIVKGRAVLQALFALTGFSRLVANYFSSRSSRKSLNK
ncbi:Pyridoxine 5'-phosphate synthase [Bienertia sinuspersici]